MSSTLQQLILSLSQHGARPALRLRTEFRTFTWSYAELGRRVRAAGYWFADNGLGTGDRVLFWASNSPTWVAAYLGCLAAGLVPVPLDLHSSPDFVERIGAETSAPLLIHGRGTSRHGEQRRGVSIDEFEWATRPGQPEREDWPTVRPDDLAEIMYTSGTTARPKGVMLTHANLCANLEGVQPIVPPEPFYRFVSLLPLSHTFEQVIGLLLPLSRGGQVTYLEAVKPTALVAALQQERPNVLVAVPRFLELFRARLEGALPAPLRSALTALNAVTYVLPWSVRCTLFGPIRARFGGSLRYLVVGGAPLDRSLERFWDGLGILVVQGYGLTEAAPVVTANTPRAYRVGSVGRPLANLRLRLGSDGEILVRGPNVTPGYYNQPEATRAAFVEGWLRTGDIGEISRDGFLYLRGRQKDLIVTSAGLKVYPEDVEAALNRQDGVRDSVVLEWQDQVFAVLLLDPLRAPDPRVVVERANRELNAIQQIHGWTLWPGADFPRTPTLKVRKFKVREALASNQVTRAIPARPLGQFERVVQGIAPDREITPAARLGPDLDLSSIDRLELITLLEEEFHVDLPEAQVTDETTVAELDALVKRGAPREPTRPDTWPLSPPVQKVRAFAQRNFVFPFLQHVMWIHVEGAENLEAIRGPVIFAGNHVSHVDGPAVLMALPERLRQRTAVAALAGFYFPPATNPLENAWHWALFDLAELLFNVFPVPRARGFRESLRYAGFLVERDWNILIFPEGTRSATGEITPFREGIGLLASELRVPIVPFRILGTRRVLPPRAWIPRPGPVVVRFGAPLTFPPIAYWDITREIEKAVVKLS